MYSRHKRLEADLDHTSLWLNVVVSWSFPKLNEAYQQHDSNTSRYCPAIVAYIQVQDRLMMRILRFPLHQLMKYGLASKSRTRGCH